MSSIRERPWLIDVISAPDAHPPPSLYDGTLDNQDVIEAAISFGSRL
jgi:acetolactate synthase I/II/III large subunit